MSFENIPATQTGEIKVGNLDIPILRLEGENRYKGQVVRFSTLPAGMGDEFSKWMTCSAIPDPDCAYLHDFISWARSKRLRGETLWL